MVHPVKAKPKAAVVQQQAVVAEKQATRLKDSKINRIFPN